MILGLAGALVMASALVACGSDDDEFVPTTPLQDQTAEVRLVAGEDGGQPEFLPPYEPGAPDASIGQTIPTISGTSLLTGEPMTIGADGRAKVIVFLAHWCGHCRNEVPRVADHLADNPLPEDVDLVAVSTSVNENAPNYEPQRWLEREGWTAPTMADSSVGLAGQVFGLGGFPYFVVVDADGTVVTRTSGEKNTDQFDQLVEAARSGAVN